MTGRPAVTVIVVTYNHSAYVAETLDSIRAQTLQPQRVIVVDDASSDGCLDAILTWRDTQNYALDVMGHVQNTGLCRGLNEALNLVRTPLYAYISGDDVMAPERLEKQVRRWVDDGSTAAVVYSNALRIDAHGEQILPDYRTEHIWPRVLEGAVHPELIRRDWLPAASLLLRTDAVRGVGGYDERWFFEDYDLLLRLAASHRFLVVDEPLVSFRELGTSLGSTRFTDADLDFLAARVGIWTAQFGVTAEGDSYLRHALPPLAIRLWQTGSRPELVRDALLASVDGPSVHLRVRSLLIRCGVRRQPRTLTLISRLAGWFRAHIRARPRAR